MVDISKCDIANYARLLLFDTIQKMNTIKK